MKIALGILSFVMGVSGGWLIWQYSHDFKLVFGIWLLFWANNIQQKEDL